VQSIFSDIFAGSKILAGNSPAGPLIVADCQGITRSGPHHTLSDALACGTGARGPFLPAAAMVVMVVVVGCWRLIGTILCRG
jgi:hypothetical protein